MLEFLQERWAYLTQVDPSAGGVSVLIGLIWLGMAAAGIQMLRGKIPSNPVRATFRRQLALSLAILGGLGVVLLLIRWLDGSLIGPGINNLPVIDWRLWSYLDLLATAGILGYLYWYFRGPYRQQVAETRHVRVVRQRQQRQPQPASAARSAGGSHEAEPKPEAITGRRDSRRGRKRKKR